MPIALQLAGCGMDGDEGGSASEAAGVKLESLTKPRYVQRATELCSDARERMSAGLESLPAGGAGRVSADDAREAMEEVILPAFRLEYEGLRQLAPPRGDEAFLDLMLMKFSRSLQIAEDDLSRLFRVKGSGYSEFAEGSLMTREYGIEGCGSLARSPRAIIDDVSL